MTLSSEMIAATLTRSILALIAHADGRTRGDDDAIRILWEARTAVLQMIPTL